MQKEAVMVQFAVLWRNFKESRKIRKNYLSEIFRLKSEMAVSPNARQQL